MVSLNACNKSDETASKHSSASQEQKTAASLTAQSMRDASLAGNIQHVRQALEEGIDINKADRAGRTALMLASFNGHRDIAQLLLDKGARIDDRNAEGRTALIFAASGPFPETVKLLLENKADPNTIDTVDGWSALMFAAAEGHKDVVQALLNANTDPNIEDKEGDTALDFARNNNHSGIASLLENSMD